MDVLTFLLVLQYTTNYYYVYSTSTLTLTIALSKYSDNLLKENNITFSSFNT